MEEPWYSTVRRLWTDYFFWTRYYIYSLMLDQSGLSYTAARVLRNAIDFAEVFTKFYGEAVSARFEELLRRHIQLLSEIATTIRTGQDYSVLEEPFYQNANDIAHFFAEINPYWDEETWRDLLYARFNAEEALMCRLNNRDFEGAVTLYEQGYNLVRDIASYMIEGISGQFGLPIPTAQSSTPR